MKCEYCKDDKEITFRRIGGEIPEEKRKNQVRSQSSGKDKHFDTLALGHTSVCLDCVEGKIRDGGFVPANIIRNATQIPSGDPLEWIRNGLEEEL